MPLAGNREQGVAVQESDVGLQEVKEKIDLKGTDLGYFMKHDILMRIYYTKISSTEEWRRTAEHVVPSKFRDMISSGS